MDVEGAHRSPADELARELRLLRDRAGLSLSRLATRAWCSRSTLERYLNGKVFPPLDTVRAISDACGGDTPAILALWEQAWAARGGKRRGRPEPAVATPAVLPRQLPPDSTHFVGRDERLAELYTMLENLSSAVVISAIDGSAGIGKTALAIHFGHQVADKFPDGQLYLDLRGYAPTPPMTAVEALEQLLRALGQPVDRIPAEGEEMAAAYRSLMSGRRMLVVLDNARGAEQVRPLLPASPDCFVMITSRTSLTALDGAASLHLDVLSGREARELLAALLGADRIATEPDAADALVELCARLPLAVRIAGARLAARPGWPIRTLVERLADEHGRLDELRAADRALRASFAASHHALQISDDPVDQTAARLFRLLGVLDWVEMSVSIAAALLDLPQPRARAALERLVDDHLLDSPAPGRYRTHDLLRLYARDLARRDEPDPERQAALTRALDCYLAAAEQATLMLNPKSDRVAADPTRHRRAGLTLSTPAEVTAWTDAERANLIAAAFGATDAVSALVVRLAGALDRPFDARGYSQDNLSIQQLAARTAERLGDRVGQAYAHHDIGWIYAQLGRDDDSVAATQRALALYRDVGNPSGELGCLTHLAHAFRHQNRHGDSLAYHERALALSRQTGHRSGEAANLDGIGMVHQRQHRFAEAIGYHRQALVIERDTGHRNGEATALVNLGWAHHRAGQRDEAITYFQHGMTLARDLGNRYQQAESLWGLGQVHHTLGTLDEAHTCWHHSIDILHDIGHLTDDQANHLRQQPIPDTPEIIQRNT